MEEKEFRYYSGLFEAILFLSSDPVKLSQFVKMTDMSSGDASDIIHTLIEDYRERDSGISIKEVSGGFQMLTNDIYSETLTKIFIERKRENLSKASLEALSIIAYKQPITIPEVDEIRGTLSRGVVFHLLRKNLIKSHGKKEVPGHPTLYVTTNEFLRKFGLFSLADLPSLEEIKDLTFDEL
jgi:segregation and condensation protein B